VNTEIAERIRERKRESRRERWANDPEYREHQREVKREYKKRNPNYLKKECERERRRFQSELHPPVTYVIGSPAVPDRVTIGTTTNMWSRFKQYQKSFVPLRLLGVTNIPEKAVHQYFARGRIGRTEFFSPTPELQEFIDNDCRFGDDECFTSEEIE
jgi:hypothetical protein